jgi:hypothetical protein
MAEQLQREYSLAVVKVHLTDTPERPAVMIDLVLNIEGEQHVTASQEFSLIDFGVDSKTSSEPHLRVPEEASSWIAAWTQDQLEPDDPIWLHLKKPYGLLGAVPWERDIQTEVQRPFLRLPDRLPEPVRPGSSFHLALLATGPAPEGVSTASQMGPKVARALAAGIGERLRLHVFADREAHDMLSQELAGLAVGDLVVYQPDEMEPAHSDRPVPVVGNEWLRWIHRAMMGRALDAVHFVTHGHALGEEGGILTTHSPTSEDRFLPVTIQAGELQAFLVRVGAAIAGFSRPYDNYSDYGLRRIVDDIGSTRAGPVLLHDSFSDPEMERLGEAYEFLTSTDPAVPPADPSVTLFAQPRQVAAVDDLYAIQPSRFEEYEWSSAVQQSLEADDTPSWISAATRYVQDSEAELIRFEQLKETRIPTDSEEAYYAGVEAALNKIRNVVDSHVEPKK